MAGAVKHVKPVKNVVFDIGGVLLRWDPRLLYARLIPDPDELDWFLSSVCTLEWNSRIDAGESFESACNELAARFPDHGELVHAWRRQEEMDGGEVPGTAALVSRLRARGVGLYLLTNMPASVFAQRRARFPVLREFDGAVVSGEEGVVKPSAEIFSVLSSRYGLDPAETLFIDDTEANVLGAQAAGFQAVRFVDAESLAASLASLGLLDR